MAFPANYINLYPDPFRKSLIISFVIIFIVSVLPQATTQSSSTTAKSVTTTGKVKSTTTTANPEGASSTDSPSPEDKEQGQDLILLPPSLMSNPTGRPNYYRNIKSLVHRKKPVYEDFLDATKLRVLNVAESSFGLFYNMFPVKKSSNFDADEGKDSESVQVRAFELLCGIVGRAVRDNIICSSDKENSTARKVISCDKQENIIIRFDKTLGNEDALCTPTEPGNPVSEECLEEKKKLPPKMRVVRGPALELIITVQSSSKAGQSIRLPANGRLKDALDLHIWKAGSPTKFVFLLTPFEFMKGPEFIQKMNRKLIAAFIKKYGSNENHNLVFVEFPEIYAKRLTITQLALRYLPTAERLARIILRWHKMMQIQLEQIHFVGASLGAHLAGVVGKILKAKSEGLQIARITGLDPIGWGFDEMDGIGVDPDMELSKDDATFVDVIHTSAPDPNYPYVHYGSNEKRGTVDFYPNNGRAQYCSKTDGLCHHFYSVILYAASIIGTNFNGCKCSSWDDFMLRRLCSPCVESAKMGEPVDQGVTGVYYLSTA